jgi:hypothetical protein
MAMFPLKLVGHVDDQHCLTAAVPASVPTGPVTVLIVPCSGEDDAGDEWIAGVAHEWSDDLDDRRQDIYSLNDGEPVLEP